MSEDGGRLKVIQVMVSPGLGDLESREIMCEECLNNTKQAESFQTEGGGAEDSRIHFTKGSFSTVVMPARGSALRTTTVQVSPPLT